LNHNRVAKNDVEEAFVLRGTFGHELKLICSFTHYHSRWSILEWKKYTKKVSEIRQENTNIDMRVRNRLDEIIEESTDKDIAIPLKFLIEYLHLAKEKEDALQELRLHVSLLDDVEQRFVIDDNTQDVYIYFVSKVSKPYE